MYYILSILLTVIAPALVGFFMARLVSKHIKSGIILFIMALSITAILIYMNEIYINPHVFLHK